MPNPQENNSNLTDKVNKIGLKAKDDISPTKTKAKGSEEEAEDDDKSPDTSPLKPLSFGKEPSVKPFGNGFASTFGSSSTTSFKGSHTTFGGGKSLGFNSFASSKTTFGNSNDQKVQTSFGSGSAFATTEEQEVEEEKKFQQQDGFRGLMIGKLINLIIGKTALL